MDSCLLLRAERRSLCCDLPVGAGQILLDAGNTLLIRLSLFDTLGRDLFLVALELSTRLRQLLINGGDLRRGLRDSGTIGANGPVEGSIVGGISVLLQAE